MTRPRNTMALIDRAATVYRLVDAKTGEDVALPAQRKCWDGYEITIRGFEPVRHESSGGKIYTTLNEVFVPSVCGLKIVDGEHPRAAAAERLAAE